MKNDNNNKVPSLELFIGNVDELSSLPNGNTSLQLKTVNNAVATFAGIYYGGFTPLVKSLKLYDRNGAKINAFRIATAWAVATTLGAKLINNYRNFVDENNEQLDIIGMAHAIDLDLTEYQPTPEQVNKIVEIANADVTRAVAEYAKIVKEYRQKIEHNARNELGALINSNTAEINNTTLQNKLATMSYNDNEPTYIKQTEIGKELRAQLIEHERVGKLTPLDVQIYNIIQEINTISLTFTTYDVWRRFFANSKRQASIKELNAIDSSINKLNSTYLQTSEITQTGKLTKGGVGGTLLGQYKIEPYNNAVRYYYKSTPLLYDYMEHNNIKRFKIDLPNFCNFYSAKPQTMNILKASLNIELTKQINLLKQSKLTYLVPQYDQKGKPITDNKGRPKMATVASNRISAKKLIEHCQRVDGKNLKKLTVRQIQKLNDKYFNYIIELLDCYTFNGFISSYDKIKTDRGKINYFAVSFCEKN